MPDQIVPNVGCDIYLNGVWWGFRDRRMHAIELGSQLRARSRRNEIRIHDRETGQVLLILPDGQLHYGDEVPAPIDL